MAASDPSEWKVCPLCDRPIPPELESRHHLIPKLRGGKHGPIAVLHTICHSKIHSLFSETELARVYNTMGYLPNSRTEVKVVTCQARG